MKGDVVQLAGKNDDKKTNGSKKSSDGKIDIDAKTFILSIQMEAVYIAKD